VRLDKVPVLSSHVRVIDTAWNLGVVVDSQLSMSAHVAAVCRGGYYQLRQLQPLKRCMTDEAIKTLTHAFISSQLDYCNYLKKLEVYIKCKDPNVTLRKLQKHYFYMILLQ